MTCDLTEFIHDLTFTDLPTEVTGQVRRCLLDLIGVAAAGSTTALSQVTRDYTVQHMNGTGSRPRLLFDGRRSSPAGAALANAATIDAVDAHDGHRLTKGHAGAAVLPAALAFLDSDPRATTRELLVDLVIGYEMANRCGMTLHNSVTEYHSSGAWNALGAAAIGARALGLSREATAHALGIAEYHAPRAPMMRCVDNPTMLKDSSSWGAHAGVSAAVLAATGFTGSPASLVDPPRSGDEDAWSSLGTTWTILEQYFKPYPVCRWCHPAVRAVLDIVDGIAVRAEDIARIDVTTFHEATRLNCRHPGTTEQAQYSLPFSVAAAAVTHDVDIGTIVNPARADPHVHRLAGGMLLGESAEMTAAFPGKRLANVTVRLADGSRYESGDMMAAGDPESPLSPVELARKFRRLATEPLGHASAEALLGYLGEVPGCELHQLLERVFTPAQQHTVQPGGYS